MRSPSPLRLSSRAAGTALFILGEIGLIAAQAQAGDILRGGRASGQPAGANNPVGTAPPPVVPAGGTTRDSLARTAQAMQAAQAMQLAARDVAKNGGNHANTNPSGNGIQLPDVPDGLGQGGLQVDPRVTGPNSNFWKGAELPTQTTNGSGEVKVTIKQTAQQALLNWDTFNVGKNTTLSFDQSAGGANVGQWIAFNQVNDPLASPTQILGKIEAPGQVYILNRNGIVFGGSSQVNVHTLTASALPINTNLVERGLINNPDLEFLFSSIKTGSFDPTLPADTRIGDVIVEAGAQLTSPSSAEKVGGRIALIGANVSNAGSISTADGQTILAAGLQVALEAHKSSDPSLRGLDVYIGAVVDPASTLTAYAGTVTNTGIIDAPRANVTMAGKDVRQMGAIHSTTSVSFNGRVDLIAEYNAVRNANYSQNPTQFSPYLINDEGTVTLGEGSIIRILPELDSTDKVVGSELALRSQVNIRGRDIHFEDNSTLVAPNAKVEVNAGEWFNSGNGEQTFVRTNGRIELDAGVLIDVSGSKNVASSVTSNIVRVELRGTELADSPLLRDGPLRGQTIYVDITETGTYNGKTWIGTPLADVSGYANLVQRTVGELTAAGGTVNLSAGGSVAIHKGAAVDVSGGWINYAGGVVKTSQVVAGGKVFDIADATPDRVYSGIFDASGTSSSPKWGTSYTYKHPVGPDGSRYQEGFTQGGSGGTLKVSAPGLKLDGQLAGSTFTGVRQRVIAPQAATLQLSFTAERYLNDTASPITVDAPTISFGGGEADFYFDPSLIGADNFGSLTLENPDGDIIIPEGVTLEAATGGSITLSGANLDIEGSVIARGGSLTFNAYNLSPQEVVDLRASSSPELPGAHPERGHFHLGAGAVLSTAGLIADERQGNAGSLLTTGGSIKISSFSANLSKGALVDVSGGVAVDARGKVSYGNAGSLSILAGRDLNLLGVTGGQLTLGATLRGMSGAKGGSLTLQSNAVQIGGSSAPSGVLHLDPSFFNQGGFAGFAIQGIGIGDATSSAPIAAVSIEDGTVIKPVVSSLRVESVSGDGPLELVEYVKPEGLRTPLSLSFTGLGATNEFASGLLVHRGDVRLGAGATVDAGPAGSITLTGHTAAVHGALIAKGGSIRVSGANSLPAVNALDSAQSTVWISSQALIDASGTTVLVPDALGRRRGAVLDGGSITVSGNLIAEAGAVLDVSGTRGTLDLTAGESGNSLAELQAGLSGVTTRPYQRKVTAADVASDGGTISLSGGQMLLSDATLLGAAGGDTAAGGTLKVSSGRFYKSGQISNPFNPTLLVTDSGLVIPESLQAGIGTIFPADSSGIDGGGRFTADDFASGGFSNLDLLGVVRFSGDVNIVADGRITAGTGAALYADGNVNLSASHLAFGLAFRTPQLQGANPLSFQNGVNQKVVLPPSFGTGTLNASAGLIDVGYLSLQGIGNANLTAANGDIRGNGTLSIAGHLGLTAGQIYPPTGVNFTIAAFDYTQAGSAHQGSVTITRAGTRQLPLSAGGSLSVYASQIHQNGVLRAPFGTIRLGWDGSGTAPSDTVLTGLNFAKALDVTLGSNSVTSVSAIDPITGKGVVIPYGISTNGSNWIDPGGNDITSSGPPQKSLQIAGESVISEAGSVVDVRGGGDLMAYRFVSGLGGTIDILGASGAYAVVPGYGSEFAPYAPFNPAADALNDDPGYVNSTLQIGDQVRLDGGGGLPAGVYTLLPAKYALLPGAYLVTPLSGSASGSSGKPDGSAIVSGYRFNGMEAGFEIPSLATRFEVARPEVIAKRAEYTRFSANNFFPGTGSLRLPGDAGQLVLAATRQMALAGSVSSSGQSGFRGGLVDISSASDIFINDGSTAGPADALVLDAGLLSSFGAASLLVGGTRSTTAEGTLVNVSTGDLVLDNGSDTLSGQEIILVAKNSIDLAAGSTLEQTGTASSGGDVLVIGTDGTAGSGNGALVRVSANTGSGLIRHGVTPGGSISLGIRAGASVRGASVTLDSTGSTLLDPTAVLQGDALSISSGRVSLALDPAVTPGGDAGLVLTASTLQGFSSASDFSLASYSSIDLLGAGTLGGVDASGNPLIDRLTLRAAELRGVGVGQGSVTINAGTVRLGGLAGAVLVNPAPADSGSLTIQADRIELGEGSLAVRGFANTRLEAEQRLQAMADGSFTTTGNLGIATPLLTASKSVKYGITATGALGVTGGGSSAAVADAGLASSLSFTGASVDFASRVVLPSGDVMLRATSGDVNVSGSLEAGGTSRRFRDQTRVTDGGRISLVSDHGDVVLAEGGVLDVSAPAAGGDAGSISISAAQGSATLAGTLSGKHKAGHDGGSFSLDVGSLASLASLDAMLNAAAFDLSRSYRIRSGDVAIDGLATSHAYQVAADAGSITVTGTIDASGLTGGDVRLVADRGLTLASTARIDASAEDFDSAGKGGAVVLESRGTAGGILQLDSGSAIDLGVASATGADTDAAKGHFSGTLHLRAPRIGDSDLAVGSLSSTISGASHIIVEGYKVYDLTASGGAITSTVQGTVKTDATAFMANAGAIESRILAANAGLGSILTVRPGAELVNTTGDLTLGGANTSGANGDWNLASFRFGSEQVPGILTLRAAGNLVFLNSLSDGFNNGAYDSALLARNDLLPDHVQSWSYRLTAGADFSAADALQVKALDQLGASSGSLLLGKNAFAGTAGSGTNTLTSTALGHNLATGFYQVIRTGSGDIDIAAGRDVQLLNTVASIYTAGTLVKDPTLGGTFDKPVPQMSTPLGSLGAIQQPVGAPVQYSSGGGNVSLYAGNDIAHYTRNGANQLIADSHRGMPVNWLYRRGYVDPVTGEFGTSRYGEVASTTWWVDFTNFFEGVGALGGGNVSLQAGRDVSNVDAVAPTNARMPKGRPDANALVELGGGDVTVRAGRNIDAGVYYVERGHGELVAGNSIITNSTRSPSLGILRNPSVLVDSNAWLGTTLFVGKSDFDVTAGKDLLLGPVANAFLLPQGYNNTYWYKTYFSTYAADSGVNASALGGSLTLRTDAYASGSTTVSQTDPALRLWFNSQLRNATTSAANFQPWLRLSESSVEPFSANFGLMPGSLRGTAFSGDIKLAGDITLSPSRRGSLELLAAGALDGFQPVGANVVNGRTVLAWTSSRINVSDTDPANIFGVEDPFAYQTLAGTDASAAVVTQNGFLRFFEDFFAETGSINGVLQEKQTLHASLLHAGDADPVRLYADGGDLSGLTLFSPKATRILASRDIRDIAFYLQNLSASDLSIVAAGRDIIAWDSATAGRVTGSTGNNQTDRTRPANAGDIQVAGPGVLEVLAGRNLDLGIGGNNADGTGTGITSIGNGRNPSLPFGGAEIFAAAGIGDATSLDDSKADFPAFITKYVKGGEGSDHLKELDRTPEEFDGLSPEEQKQVALKVFFFVLRDAGRDHNDPDSPGFGNYDAGKDAVATLFPGTSWEGNITTRSRDIRTRNGGDITLVLPGGSLTLATSAQSNILAPPGIITESGGAINVFTDLNVDLGISRIFTLRGGDEIIWSTRGNIAAGSSSKTVQSAPPTRVLIDPQSADVRTDLAGLATGGGIGVLSTVAGVDPADVDLVAPEGTIDAGDAGIRVSGNLNIAAAVVVNASNISVGGSSAGAAPSSVAAPSVASITSASNTTAATTAATSSQGKTEQAGNKEQAADSPSLITAEVIGYGGSADGGSGDEEEDEEKQGGEGEEEAATE